MNKISIIIPIYNVEDYLVECVDSVRNQTYQNLEIILVDDGSTDKSGSLCDEMEWKDSRIKVIHKQNGGLSDARNAGLEVASGDYIGFVDADDYIESNMYELLINLCVKYDVPIACSRFDCVGESTDDTIPDPKHYERVLSDIEAIEAITSSEKWNSIFMTVSVWDRLYRRDIINDLKFPKGKNFEDIVYSTQAFINARKCVYIDEVLYHYRIRKGSITNQDDFDSRWITDKLLLEKEKVALLRGCGYKKLELLTRRISYGDLSIIKGKCSDSEMVKEIDNSMAMMKLNLFEVFEMDGGLKMKIKYCIKNNFNPLYKMLKCLHK